jgi:hypothetical protein
VRRTVTAMRKGGAIKEIAATEWTTAEIERFIIKWSRAGEATPHDEEWRWQRSMRLYYERAEVRRRWRENHTHMATRHGWLAAEHEIRAEGLCGEAHGRRDDGYANDTD